MEPTCDWCGEESCDCEVDPVVCDLCGDTATDEVEDYLVCLDHKIDAIDIVRRRGWQL